MPGLAIFAAAAEVGLGIDAAHLQPGHAADREHRQQRDIEAAIGVQQRGIRAVQPDAFLRGDEHGHPRAVLAAIEHLLDLVILRLELHLGPPQQTTGAGREVVVINARRRGNAGKAVEGLPIGPLAAETEGRTDARQSDVADELARERKNLYPAYNVLEISGDKLIAHQVHLDQGGLALRDDLLPIGRLRPPHVNGNKPPARGSHVGLEEQHRSVVADIGILVLEIVDQLDRHRVRFGQVADEDPLPLVRPAHDGDHEPAAIGRSHAVILPFGVVRPPVDQGIGRLRRAEAVVIELVVEIERLELGAPPRLLVASVEESLAVFRPRRIGELRPLQLIAQGTACGSLDDVQGRPIGAGLGAGVGHVAAVLAEAHPGHGDGAVLRPPVRIQQHPRRAVERVHRVQDGLVLKAVVLQVVIPASLFHEGGILGEIPQLGQPAANGRPFGNRFQVAGGELVLRRHPGRHLRRVTHVGFEPAIRIGHLDAMIDIHLIHAPARRVLDPIILGQGRQGHGQKGQRRRQREQGTTSRPPDPVFGNHLGTSHSDRPMRERITGIIAGRRCQGRGPYWRRPSSPGGSILGGRSCNTCWTFPKRCSSRSATNPARPIACCRWMRQPASGG